MPPVRILSSALHHYPAEDVDHAYRMALCMVPWREGESFMIGPARNGDLLELFVRGRGPRCA